MIDTRESNLVNSGIFVEIETGDVISGPGYFRPHTAPTTLSRADREPKSRSTRSTPHRKNVTPRAATCRESTTKISLSPLLDAPRSATKISTNLRTSCARPAQEILSTRPLLVDQRHAAVMIRSAER